MRRKAKKREAVDDLVDELVRMRRKAKKASARRELNRPTSRRSKTKKLKHAPDRTRRGVTGH